MHYLTKSGRAAFKYNFLISMDLTKDNLFTNASIAAFLPRNHGKFLDVFAQFAPFKYEQWSLQTG